MTEPDPTTVHDPNDMVRITPTSRAARLWLQEHVDDDVGVWWFGALMVAHRNLQAILDGLTKAGFKV